MKDKNISTGYDGNLIYLTWFVGLFISVMFKILSTFNPDKLQPTSYEKKEQRIPDGNFHTVFLCDFAFRL